MSKFMVAVFGMVLSGKNAISRACTEDLTVEGMLVYGTCEYDLARLGYCLFEGMNHRFGINVPSDSSESDSM